MKTNLTIKNFRVFDENGVTIELNPITILTGCNSSGKSSIVKAVLLLDEFLKQIKKAIDNEDEIKLDEYKIDFYKYPINLLGRFDKTVHEGSTIHKVTMEYSTYSNMISKDVNVQLVFAADNNDELNNAYLDRISISTEDGLFYSSDRSEGSICNLNIIKNACLEFLPIEFVIHNYCGLENAYEFGWYYGDKKITQTEYEDQKKEMIDYLRKCDKKCRTDVLKYVRTTKKSESIVAKYKANPEILEWTMQNGSLFRIPIIEQISSIHKDNLLDFFDNGFLKNARKEIVFATYKILTDFINSDCLSFDEYFKQYEKEYFNEIRIGNNRLFARQQKSIDLLNLHDIGHIEQDYLAFSIYDSPSVLGSFDKQDTESEEEKTLRHTKEIKDWEDRPITFGMIYEVVMEWNRIAGSEGISYYYDLKTSGFDEYCHRMLTLLSAFASEFVQEVVCPDWCDHLEYASSSRAVVKRLYSLDTDTENQFSKLLKRYFDKKRKLRQGQKERGWTLLNNPYEIDSFINKWIKQFGLGESISMETDAEGLGVKVWLHKNSSDKHLLADEGFGVTQLISVLLQIETAILSAEGEKINRMFGLDYLDGYDYDRFHYEVNTLAIEEPEIHLHPSFQSLLADMFLEAYEKYNIHFIVETHSEYLIRESQVLVSKMGFDSNEDSDKNSPFRTYYIPANDVPYSLGYRKDGKFAESFGKGFFNEAADLAFKIL